MKILKAIWRASAAAGALGNIVAVLGTQAASAPLEEGARVDLGGRTATIRKLDNLPYVESDYTKRFKFDSFENPKLEERSKF